MTLEQMRDNCYSAGYCDAITHVRNWFKELERKKFLSDMRINQKNLTGILGAINDNARAFKADPDEFDLMTVPVKDKKGKPAGHEFKYILNRESCIELCAGSPKLGNALFKMQAKKLLEANNGN
ncbi:MAG: hypothetical protein FWE09_00200 [Treponema sp.]|nr:hypothetical protein [Treponema sp.]